MSRQIETPTFTAKQVRGVIESWDDLSVELNQDECDRIVYMLTAYADRLEQDERPAQLRSMTVENRGEYMIVRDSTSGAFVTVHKETLRDEGRLEVYREIAAMTLLPIEHDYSTFKVVHSTCAFCGREPIAYQIGEEHAPNCLWLRATAALRETTPTPLIVERMTADTVIVGRGYRRNPETGEIEPV